MQFPRGGNEYTSYTIGKTRDLSCRINMRHGTRRQTLTQRPRVTASLGDANAHQNSSRFSPTPLAENQCGYPERSVGSFQLNAKDSGEWPTERAEVITRRSRRIPKAPRRIMNPTKHGPCSVRYQRLNPPCESPQLGVGTNAHRGRSTSSSCNWNGQSARLGKFFTKKCFAFPEFLATCVRSEWLRLLRMPFSSRAPLSAIALISGGKSSKPGQCRREWKTSARRELRGEIPTRAFHF